MKAITNKKKLTSEQQEARQNGARRKLISQIEFLQMRVAAAEETWKQAKEQFSQAKRRRKLAKLFARRAKKDTKGAAANLDLVRKALADAKTQVMTIGWRATSRKGSKTKNVVALSKKRPTPRRHARKTAVDTIKSISHESLAALLTATEGVPGNPDAGALLLATIQPGEAGAVA